MHKKSFDPPTSAIHQAPSMPIHRAKRHSGHGGRLRVDKQIGANMMRSSLVLGLLMTLCASANAATVNHSRTHHHVTASNSQGVTLGFAVTRWAYTTTRSPVGSGGFGGGGHMKRFGGVRVRGLAVGGIGRFGVSYISLGDHDVHHHTTLRYGRYWSGYSLYAYDPDPYDFFFRHPDYPWQPIS
jgi:hypothetical protein